MTNKRNSRGKVGVYIDGENVGATNYNLISSIMKKRGELAFVNVYGIAGDKYTRNWTQEAQNDKRLKEIRLSGGPSKNKVDKKIQQDICRDVKKSKDIGKVILVTSDHGYKGVVEKMKSYGIEVTVIGKNISKALMAVCDLYYDL